MFPMQIHNCYTLFLCVSHPITMNDKINSAFWDQIVEPYNSNHLTGIIKRWLKKNNVGVLPPLPPLHICGLPPHILSTCEILPQHPPSQCGSFVVVTLLS
jgi:hypothetical protein